MIDVQSWIDALGFDQYNKLKINDNCIIEIDIEAEKIIYPKLKEIGRETTINFSSEENFVVLDCVIQLLKQGYEPSHISIEKSYKLGHNKKSGNADITVEDNEGNPFLIIENKTYGHEFEKEWKNTLADGGQLFSYEKQENKASALVLYAAKVEGKSIKRMYHAISLIDNEVFLKSLGSPNGYKDAKGGGDKFSIWSNIYENNYITNGVLESSIKPFEIGKPKVSIADLKSITHDEVQSKYNQFTTILRKYNVGGRENAFDKLVNLFLAKIVDEEQNDKDLQFYWKGVSYDSYFNLVDRLQRLYQIGMERFLAEKVSYVGEQDVIDAFRLRRDAAKDAILKYFKALKYFSNNDFTFLDVYNESLFYQNSEILVEVVQILQDMKLKSNDQNQFLGDLFEGFLDSGVKQSEGQYFTPLPIVKFIIASLPLKSVNEEDEIPKVIDYACGAGHFLNEYATQLKDLIDVNKIDKYYSKIYGIEKEYRLSKVAKVSAFMYGQDEINIIYGDALDSHKSIEDNTFSVLIANPPYSVKGFLETLPESQRKTYSLYKYIDKPYVNNSIELFFLEKAKQLLKTKGVAGIILPSSVLSNSGLYVKARKLLLENFDIISIVELGSKTFGSTGTNTVILFLRKKKYPPSESDSYRYAVERWFGSSDVQSEDIQLIKCYCDKVGIDYNDYKTLQCDELSTELLESKFSDYDEFFKKSSTLKRIQNKKITNKYNQEKQKHEIVSARNDFIRSIEKEKVTYFSIANSQKNPVIYVKSPEVTEKIKQFLGYEWSKRKGREGIKYTGVDLSDDDIEVSKSSAINKMVTPLFNPLNLEDPVKINHLIKSNFEDEKGLVVPEEVKEYTSIIPLIDLFDFSDVTFGVELNVNANQVFDIKSKYPIYKLSSNELGISIIKGVTYNKKNQVVAPSEVKVLTADNITLSGEFKVNKIIYLNKKIDLNQTKQLRKDDIFINFSSGSKKHVGKVAFMEENTDYYAGGFMGIIRVSGNLVLPRFLFELLNSKLYRNLVVNFSTGANINNLSNTINKLLIPVPPIEIQNEIIEEIKQLKNDYVESKISLEQYQNSVMDVLVGFEVIEQGVID